MNELLNIPIHIIGSNSFNYYSVMRIIQTMMGILILTIGMYTYLQLKQKNTNQKNKCYTLNHIDIIWSNGSIQRINFDVFYIYSFRK